jgi:hypothetical protein
MLRSKELSTGFRFFDTYIRQAWPKRPRAGAWTGGVVLRTRPKKDHDPHLEPVSWRSEFEISHAETYRPGPT